MIMAMKLLISTFILFIYQQLRTLLFVSFTFYIFFYLELLYKTLFLEKFLIPSKFNLYVLKKPEIGRNVCIKLLRHVKKLPVAPIISLIYIIYVH